MASRIPSAQSAAISSFCPRRGVIIADSVISSVMREGSPPAALISRSIAAAPICWQVSGGKLIDIAWSLPAACQTAACRLASAITHSLIGRIRPVRSASGMKSSGAIMPRSGSFQRRSASAPVMAPDRELDDGW